MESHHTGNPWTCLEVKRSRSPGWLMLSQTMHHTQVGSITIFLKLASQRLLKSNNEITSRCSCNLVINRKQIKTKGTILQREANTARKLDENKTAMTRSHQSIDHRSIAYIDLLGEPERLYRSCCAMLLTLRPWFLKIVRCNGTYNWLSVGHFGSQLSGA